MKYRWSLAPAQPLLVSRLANELGVSPLLAQCLLNRGLSEPHSIEAFLEPRLKHLADPFLIPNMTPAVERLFRAREAGEPMVIFGDYDVDGIASTALLTEVLRTLGWRVSYYLPHRMDEGYGLTRDGVENCLSKFNPKLLLAVDCGSTAAETIRWLGERGVDVLVLDHHQVSSPAPPAVALVNPQLNPDSQAPFKELCSGGLAFKLAHALVKRGRELGLPEAHSFDLRPLLDMVALATVADLVPLVRENRILARAGFEWLNRTKRPGLVALKEAAQVSGSVGCYEVGFQLAPRLNAAGRLADAEAALNLLLAKDVGEAMPIAMELDARNRERQRIERNIADEVIGAARARFNPETDFVIVEGQMLWHIGVVGIVASRVLREFYRPTVIIGGDGEEWRGSGRSIEGFDLAAALRACDDLLVKHGGHAMAAGLTIRPERLDAFRARLNEMAGKLLSPGQLIPSLRLDVEVNAGQLTLETVEELQGIEPVGQGNSPIQIVLKNVRQQQAPRRMGKEQQHAKLWVGDGRQTLEVVWWNAGKSPLPEGLCDIAATVDINEFNGRRSVQLKLLDWRPAA